MYMFVCILYTAVSYSAYTKFYPLISYELVDKSDIW